MIQIKHAKHILAILTLVLSLMFTVSCKKADDVIQPNSTQSNDMDTLQSAYSDSTEKDGNYYLTEYDTPPTPINNPMPSYPAHFRSSGIQGIVVLEASINEFGKVDDVKVFKSLLSGEGALDDTAAKAVMGWTFKPALLKNKPVKAKINIPVPFNLKRND